MNMLYTGAIVAMCFVGTSLGQVISYGACPVVNVQSDFDINRYMGKWYEMERFFAIFEAFSKCVTAEYTLMEDGVVQVNNTGYNSLLRRNNIAYGSAVADINEPAKLGVSFSEGQPRGDYWVLSTDYDTYSIVWSCSQWSFGPWTWNTQFGWILTRSQNGIEESKKAGLYSLMTGYGINTRQFSRTSQTNCQ